MLGIHGVCFPQYSCSSIPMPCWTPLIFPVGTCRREDTYQSDAGTEASVSSAVWFVVQLGLEIVWQSAFKSIHCACNWYWSYCVQICRALWYKIHPNFKNKIMSFCCTIHNLVCTNLSVFQLSFPSLISLIYCVNHVMVMELYITVKFCNFFRAIEFHKKQILKIIIQEIKCLWTG